MDTFGGKFVVGNVMRGDPGRPGIQIECFENIIGELMPRKQKFKL
jgi:hypothetical protein